MSVKQDKIDAIKKYLPGCTTSSRYVYGEIPRDKLKTAISSYAYGIAENDVIGMIDISFAQDGRKGFVFTYNGFSSDVKPGLTEYSDGFQFESLPWLHYDLNAVNQLLHQLYSAEKVSDIKAYAVKTFASAIFNGFLESQERGKQQALQQRYDEMEKLHSLLETIRRSIEKTLKLLERSERHDEVDELEFNRIQDSFTKTMSLLDNEERFAQIDSIIEDAHKDYDESFGDIIAFVKKKTDKICNALEETHDINVYCRSIKELLEDLDEDIEENEQIFLEIMGEFEEKMCENK